MARSNGGILGKINTTSFGKCTQTVKTATGNVCTQPGTRIANVLLVAGGGGGGGNVGGGGGAGGLRNLSSIAIDGNTAVPVTIGGAGNPGADETQGGAGGCSSIVASGTTYTSVGGGGGGARTGPAQSKNDGAPGGSGGGGSGANSGSPFEGGT